MRATFSLATRPGSALSTHVGCLNRRRSRSTDRAISIRFNGHRTTPCAVSPSRRHPGAITDKAERAPLCSSALAIRDDDGLGGPHRARFAGSLATVPCTVSGAPRLRDGNIACARGSRWPSTLCTGSHSGHEGDFQLRFLVREVVSGCSCRAPGCSRATARAIRIRFNGHRRKPCAVGPVAMEL